MSWLEVKAVFDKAPADWSLFIDAFGRYGCENTLQTDTPPTLSSAVVCVEGAQEVVDSLKTELLELGAQEVDVRSLVEENWEENWKQFFKPRRIGKRLIVRPTWESVELKPGEVEVVLDPGQAFGTGDHPTTRMCLELLEKTLQAGDSLADIGCGSGILSVAAVKLGASPVVAVDIEPLSVEVAKENAALNGVGFDAICGAGVDALDPSSRQFDVVVSNIISATLISIARDVAKIIQPGGKWIVSGIIEQNWQDVLGAAGRSGFQLSEQHSEDGWVAAILVKA